jgi:hypothetical protein
MEIKNKNYLKYFIILLDKYIFFNLIKTFHSFLRSYFFSAGITFNGWGMITYTNLPWQNTVNKNSIEFEKVNNKMKLLVKLNKFKLSQILKEENKNKKKIDHTLNILDQLKWRHYIVYISVLLAIKSHKGKINLVECGVCDGLTIFYVLNALKNKKYSIFLYDSWKKMKKEFLKKNELHHYGDYDYLDLNNTQKNLKDFKKNLIYNVGYIPQVFEKYNYPKKISWLHIDLNASKPTIDALNFFFKKILSNGVILFDDYNHLSYEPTKLAIDKFFKNKEGQFIALPTGQSIFVKI